MTILNSDTKTTYLKLPTINVILLAIQPITCKTNIDDKIFNDLFH